ncbi:MAG TPA: DegV family protein [Acidimicrobiales bacterium]|jgi:DegV family protein with EDD domain
MPGVKIVTDSSCDLPQEVVEKHGIRVVPLTIRFGDEEFVDVEELSATAFYAKMAETDALPATAAPGPGQFEQAFREAAADGSSVVCLNLSSHLSATMQSAQNGAQAVDGEIDVRVIDSLGITASLGNQVIAAAEAAAAGATADEVVAVAADIRSRSHIFGALDTLENLKKGGRIGGAQAMIGTMLSIKPLIDISSGEVVEAGKQRTRRRAMLWLRDRLFEEPEVERLTVCQGGAPDVEEFIDLLAPRYSREQFSMCTIGPVIGTHGGPRVVGLSWVNPKTP